jgi:hypothetical protein
MRKLLIPILILSVVSAAYAAPPRLQARQAVKQTKQQKQQQRQQNLQPIVRPNGTIRAGAVRRSVAQAAIYDLYQKQFRQDGEFSDEIRGKMLPFLEQFLEDRFEISQRRGRALNQLRQAIAGGAPEDDLIRLTREIDAADAQFQTNHEKFLNSVDPLLTPRQQAKVRVIQELADRRIRQALEAVQNPNADAR